MKLPQGPGPIALVGSGEYLEVMEGTDRILLDLIGGPAAARVVVLPTASGQEEPGSWARWVRLGVEHFTRLGATVEAAVILDREAAHDPQWLQMLEAADFFYFSGGNPQHVIETMTGSPAWEVIRRRYEAGAALAGCSAGAMAICGYTSGLRAMRAGRDPEWIPALGVLPKLIVMPHFDRLSQFIGQEVLQRAVAAVPEGMLLIGVDEETALVRLEPQATPEGASRWQVTGNQQVTVYHVLGEAGPLVFGPGDIVLLKDQ